jgi:hypothetical protein
LFVHSFEKQKLGNPAQAFKLGFASPIRFARMNHAMHILFVEDEANRSTPNRAWLKGTRLCCYYCGDNASDGYNLRLPENESDAIVLILASREKTDHQS